MNATSPTVLEKVRDVYDGTEGDLWELLMGQQIHVGGFKSSMDLATGANIGAGQSGIDLGCCNGAGMRFLVYFRDVAHMTGVDATETVVRRGQARCDAEGLSDRISFVQADACESGLPSGEADFVWAEDAWCYVVDKSALVAEAARLIKPGGTIAFTDWVTGPEPMSSSEQDRFLTFMKFPNCQSVTGYREVLEDNGVSVVSAEDTGRFAKWLDLTHAMVDQQLTYDVLRIFNFDKDVFEGFGAEMEFMRGLAHDGKIVQGRFIAKLG